MKYEKPEVVVLASATDAVRSTNKSILNVQESFGPPGQYAQTVNAYEADE